MSKAPKTARAPRASKATQKPATRAIRAAQKAAPEAEAEDAEDAPAPRSVVGAAYKARYRSREGSSKGRNCADWLAQELAGLVLEGGKLQPERLAAICAQNAVSSEYSNRSKGWEGRMRMTLGLRLRPVVAAQGFLLVPTGKKTPEKRIAPPAFRAAWQK